jgi:uncharacterized membrane protein
MDLFATADDLAFFVRGLNGLLTAVCQLLALLVIAIGILRALAIFLKDSLFSSQPSVSFQRSRLVMGYSFSLGLSFLIGATILKTMISNGWDDIARLAAIIAVRTALNFLLLRTINQESAATETPELAAAPPEESAQVA